MFTGAREECCFTDRPNPFLSKLFWGTVYRSIPNGFQFGFWTAVDITGFLSCNQYRVKLAEEGRIFFVIDIN